MGFDSIDIIKLFAGTAPGFEDDYVSVVDDGKHAVFNTEKSGNMLRSHDKWNNWLTKCERNNNINELVDARRRLQMGMDDAVKKRMSSEFLGEMFIRWTGSIERTARRIIKKKYPMPPKTDRNFGEWHKAKKDRQVEFEKFLLKSSY